MDLDIQMDPLRAIIYSSQIFRQVNSPRVDQSATWLIASWFVGECLVTICHPCLSSRKGTCAVTDGTRE